MIRLERFILFASALLLLIQILHPPYMFIDPETQGRVPAVLGYHPFWNPPSAAEAYYTLYPNARELPPPERLAGLTLGINRVRLTVGILAIVLGGGLGLTLLRRWR